MSLREKLRRLRQTLAREKPSVKDPALDDDFHDPFARAERLEQERDQYREGWLARGRQINEEGNELRKRTEAVEATIEEAAKDFFNRADETRSLPQVHDTWLCAAYRLRYLQALAKEAANDQ